MADPPPLNPRVLSSPELIENILKFCASPRDMLALASTCMTTYNVFVSATIHGRIPLMCFVCGYWILPGEPRKVVDCVKAPLEMDDKDAVPGESMAVRLGRQRNIADELLAKATKNVTNNLLDRWCTPRVRCVMHDTSSARIGKVSDFRSYHCYHQDPAITYSPVVVTMVFSKTRLPGVRIVNNAFPAGCICTCLTFNLFDFNKFEVKGTCEDCGRFWATMPDTKGSMSIALRTAGRCGFCLHLCRKCEGQTRKKVFASRYHNECHYRSHSIEPVSCLCQQ